ncbi:Cytochrome c [Catalinimonas alkaloidigena]|uniref:Cytochrome c n=2 Tax=Catalinimonas alkaloidigena TaxID=1075417 RepID=A0A1G9RBM9_9BACT|nr:Cytochrome c [Catalinimonas alkaloidigena]
MQRYRELRDAEGNMEWVDPQPLENYLVTVDLALLDFLPEGFAEEVQNGLPFRGHTVATSDLIDSLYYSLSVHESVKADPRVDTRVNEPYDGDPMSMDTLVLAATYNPYCGIDPARIKAIRSSEFQRTFLATREFEARLQWLFQACSSQAFDYYVHHLDEPLWKADREASQLVSGRLKERFEAFAEQRLTNVKDGAQYAQALQGFYEKRLKAVKAELEAAWEKVQTQRAAQHKADQQIVDQYKALLFKRETYRMETYGFTMTEAGWVNIDRGTLEKDWTSGTLEVRVANAADFERVYAYVVYPSIRSLFRLNPESKERFYVGDATTHEMLMPRRAPALVVTIGYRNGDSTHTLTRFRTLEETELSVVLDPTHPRSLADDLAPYANYLPENSIQEDLRWMKKLDEIEQRQQVRCAERRWLHELHTIAYPCRVSILIEQEAFRGDTVANQEICDQDFGEALFTSECRGCHSVTGQSPVGPALAGVTQRRSPEWLMKFIRHPQATIEGGDPEAVALYERYRQYMPNASYLTRSQIRAILAYVEK